MNYNGFSRREDRLRLICWSACLCAMPVLGSCRDVERPPITMEEIRTEQGPREEAENARLRLSEEGRPRMEIEAPVMRTFEREDSTYTILERDTFPDQVLVRLFDEAGEPSAVLRANTVLRYSDGVRFEARGDVVVVTEDAKRLQTEQLFWRESDRTIETSGFVTIDTPTEQIRGYDLVADEDLATYRLNRVTGRVIVKDEG